MFFPNFFNMRMWLQWCNSITWSMKCINTRKVSKWNWTLHFLWVRFVVLLCFDGLVHLKWQNLYLSVIRLLHHHELDRPTSTWTLYFLVKQNFICCNSMFCKLSLRHKHVDSDWPAYNTTPGTLLYSWFCMAFALNSHHTRSVGTAVVMRSHDRIMWSHSRPYSLLDSYPLSLPLLLVHSASTSAVNNNKHSITDGTGECIRMWACMVGTNRIHCAKKVSMTFQ